MDLKNKRILITAGPTWVPIDTVRVISNIATGATGILLAERFVRQGAKVTLLLGPAEDCRVNKTINLKRFRFYAELKEKAVKEVRSGSYDVIIHSAAVSDFTPIKRRRVKITSKKPLNIRLVPLPKIVDIMRRVAPRAKLVMFKLEPGISDNALVKRAKEAQEKAGADMVIANKIEPYRAFIIYEKGIISVKSKRALAYNLINLL
ncbi:MAG: hypothetical protein JW788_00900 [Candidatus Omnitrophica bacterium]|nr:hypothetical protein [Candidatus Omnitrophota bacterium]